jgi:formate hydrogenlyase subunit 3/multisubunit Na+/H+ antiporter MnhD subunit
MEGEAATMNNSPWLTLPILLISTLLLAAGVTYLTRRWERLTALFGIVVTGFWATLLWQVDLREPLWILPTGQTVDMGAPIERLGFTLRLEAGAVPMLTAMLFLVAAAFVIAACLSQGRSFVPFGLMLVAGYASVTLLSTSPLPPPLIIPLLLAILAIVGVFVLQAGRLTTPAGPLRSLIPPLLAFPFFLIAPWYIDQIPLNPQDLSAAQTAAQLLSLGLVLLLAPVPLHGAQAAIAQSAPPVTTALLTLLGQLAALHLLYRTLATFEFVPQQAPLGLWLTWIGLITAVWGGVAALGATHAGRLWGYAALHDWGVILLILAAPGSRGWSLVLFLFGLRVVSMLTGAVGLAVLEQHTGGLSLERVQGAGSRLPWNSAAVLLGGLGLAGFPLSAGFTGHWAALQIVAESDWRLAAVVLLASAGAIFGYIRLARALFGPLENRFLSRELPLNVFLALFVLLISIGLAVAPQLMDIPIGRALLAFSN